MSHYGISASQGVKFLTEGQCYPTAPDVKWIIVGWPEGDGVVQMRLLDPVNGGDVVLYFAPSTMVDDAGNHPALRPTK